MWKCLCLPLLLSTFIISGCSLAPISGPKSANTLGKSKIKAVTAVYPAVAQGIEFGLLERTDIGGLIEMQGAMVLSAWLKQGLIQQADGHALSAIVGAFDSEAITRSYGGYAGILWNYNTGGRWSPYGTLKVNHVTWEPDGIDDNEIIDLPDYFSSNTDNESFQYYQLNAGVTYQFSPALNMSLGVISLGDDEDGYYTQPQLSFGFTFN